MRLNNNKVTISRLVGGEKWFATESSPVLSPSSLSSASVTSRKATVPLTDPQTTSIGFPVGLLDGLINLNE